jgi:hypothetical protein
VFTVIIAAVHFWTATLVVFRWLSTIHPEDGDSMFL